MADLVVTAANVQAAQTSRTRLVKYGATITAGQSVYLDTADSEWKLADADNSLLTAGSAGVGVALTPGADGEYGLICIGGLYDSGSTPTEGQVYVVSDTPGGIKPAADLVTGDNCTVLGVGAASNQIDLKPLYASGQTIP